jgi:hypothetical protein
MDWKQMTDSAFQVAVEIVAVQAEACLPPELSTGELEAIVKRNEAGLEQGFFDTDQATFDAWLAKTGKATALIQNSSAGQSQASQQVFQHCRQMASYWEPARVA